MYKLEGVRLCRKGSCNSGTLGKDLSSSSARLDCEWDTCLIPNTLSLAGINCRGIEIATRSDVASEDRTRLRDASNTDHAVEQSD